MANAPPACASPTPQVQTLWHALRLFRLLADGFRDADLRQNLADIEGRSAQPDGCGAIACQLRRLSLLDMIGRPPNTHQVEDDQVRRLAGHASCRSEPEPR